MKIVAIEGSPRLNGNTSYLTDKALEEAKKLGIETSKIILDKYQINPCQGHDCHNFTACVRKDDTQQIIQELYAADGIILASPVYYYGVTAQMKAFIDRNVFYRRHKQSMKARSAGIIVVATSAGVGDTANALVRFLSLASDIPAEKIIQVRGLARAAGEIKSNAPVVEQAARMGRSMAEELSKV